jgi:hypothetical protein
MGWLERAPLWIIWPTLSAVLLIAVAIGFFVGRLIERRRGQGETSDGVGFLLSAALGLLGLLIAFTFSMASERFDARRQAVLQESNAVGTTYLRFQLLDEPFRNTLSQELLSYLDARRSFFAAGADPSAVDRADSLTGEVENRIWTGLTDWVRSHSENTSNVALLQATNDMFDLAASDRAMREARVPLTIVRAITLYSLIAALLLGQSLAAKKDNHPIAAATIFVLVALSISLILDLDRPATGTITVSTTTFDRAVDSIRAMEVEKQVKRQ